jgi:hypothetical protein
MIIANIENCFGCLHELPISQHSAYLKQRTSVGDRRSSHRSSSWWHSRAAWPVAASNTTPHCRQSTAAPSSSPPADTRSVTACVHGEKEAEREEEEEEEEERGTSENPHDDAKAPDAAKCTGVADILQGPVRMDMRGSEMRGQGEQ